MTIISRKPPLFHASPHSIEGDFIVPKPNFTAVWHQFTDSDEYLNHQGDLIFSGDDLNAAYLYAFKLRDPHLREHDRPYDYMTSLCHYTLANGNRIQTTVINRRSDYMKLLQKASPAIYRVPTSNDFEQVMNRNGRATSEYISRSPLAVEDCEKIQLHSLDDALKRGAQIFFLKKDVDSSEWEQIYRNESDRIKDYVYDYKGDPEELSTTVPLLYLKFYDKMVKAGILEHYNVERGICALDLQTGEFRENEKPTNFTNKAKHNLGRALGE